ALTQVIAIAPRRRLGERGIGMRVQVDEARRDVQAGAIDDLRRSCDGELADGDDAFALEGDVADDAGLAAAVEEGAALEDEVGLNGGVRAQREREEEDGGVHGGILSSPRAASQAPATSVGWVESSRPTMRLQGRGGPRRLDPPYRLADSQAPEKLQAA